MGNYLGDFITNKQLKELPKGVQEGIRLHRFIDTYTDTHPLVKVGTKMLHPSMHKYAPVVIDIYFDFLLSKHWNLFHEWDIERFCSGIYKTLMAFDGPMPAFMLGRRRRMVESRWLEDYQTYQGLDKVFTFLSKRAKFSSNLLQASQVLKELENALESQVFLPFFPVLIKAVQEQIGDYPSK